MRPSDPEQSSLADEAKKMRVEDDDMELLTAVHDEPAVPEEPQMPTPPRWDELTGDLLLADLTHLQRRRKCMVSTRSFAFPQRFHELKVSSGQESNPSGLDESESTTEILNTQTCECDSSQESSMLRRFAQTRLLEHVRCSYFVCSSALLRARVDVKKRS